MAVEARVRFLRDLLARGMHANVHVSCNPTARTERVSVIGWPQKMGQGMSSQMGLTILDKILAELPTMIVTDRGRANSKGATEVAFFLKGRQDAPPQADEGLEVDAVSQRDVNSDMHSEEQEGASDVVERQCEIDSITENSIVRVAWDTQSILAAARKAGVRECNDHRRKQAAGRLGRVLEVDAADHTAKVHVPEVGNVWLSLSSVALEMGTPHRMPDAAEIPTTPTSSEEEHEGDLDDAEDPDSGEEAETKCDSANEAATSRSRSRSRSRSPEVETQAEHAASVHGAAKSSARGHRPRTAERSKKKGGRRH